MSELQPGLRERKRVATRLAIERAAVTLALRNGYDRVTVDEISEVANVSPRTFFNYFPSKEAAMLGGKSALPSEERLRVFLEAGPGQSILDGIRDVIAEVMSGHEAPEMHELFVLRQKLMVRHPELMQLRMAKAAEMEQQMADLVGERLVRDHPRLADDPEELAARARLVVFIAMATVRHAWSCWAELGGRGEVASSLDRSFDMLHELASPEFRDVAATR